MEYDHSVREIELTFSLPPQLIPSSRKFMSSFKTRPCYTITIFNFGKYSKLLDVFSRIILQSDNSNFLFKQNTIACYDCLHENDLFSKDIPNSLH